MSDKRQVKVFIASPGALVIEGRAFKDDWSYTEEQSTEPLNASRKLVRTRPPPFRSPKPDEAQ